MSKQSVAVKFFGMTAEKMGRESADITLENTAIVNVKSLIYEHFTELQGMDFTVAVNQEIMREIPKDISISEIAILPPFAGG